MEGKREFTQNVLHRIWKAMRDDKVFQRQAHAIKGKGDKTRAAQFINAKFAELAPSIFRSYKNTMYPSLSRMASETERTANADEWQASSKSGSHAADEWPSDQSEGSTWRK